MAAPHIVLASASPRRTGLLESWGVRHRVIPSEIDETIDPFGAPAAEAERLARLKAEDVRRRIEADGLAPSTWVVGADTLVVVDSRCLGKPPSEAGALQMLMTLSGRTVEVVTGVALLGPGRNDEMVFHDTSSVTMRRFGRLEAQAYVATGEPIGKAGAFAIQGKGAVLIASWRGSRSNIIGLPRQPVLEALRRIGWCDECV